MYQVNKITEGEKRTNQNNHENIDTVPILDYKLPGHCSHFYTYCHLLSVNQQYYYGGKKLLYITRYQVNANNNHAPSEILIGRNMKPLN